MSNLKESSIKKYASVLVRIHKAGLTQTDILNMSDKQVKDALGMKNLSSAKGLKKNVRSLSIDDGRIEQIKKTSIKTLKKEGWKGKGLEIQKEQMLDKIDLPFIKQYTKATHFPKKEKGNYAISEVRDTDGSSYYIKYTDVHDFDSQFDILKEKYKFPKHPTIIFHGFYAYEPFVMESLKSM